MAATSRVETSWYDQSTSRYCETIQLRLQGAMTSVAKMLEFNSTPQLDSTLDLNFQLDFASLNTNAPNQPLIIFVSEERSRSTNSSVAQGSYIFFPDGTVARRGIFTNSTFDPGVSGTLVNVSASSYSLSSSIPAGSGAISLQFESDVIAKLDGNMNPDDDGSVVCYTDRAILHGLLGVSMGSASYNPRCDLDYDGDIDQADMAIFNTLPCNADWDCSTTAPRVNSLDYNAFLNSFNSSDPVADVNGDGNLNILDYSAFSNAANVGCN